MSSIDEYITKYRYIPIRKKLMLLGALAIAPAINLYMSEIDYLVENLESKTRIFEKKKSEYEKAKQKKAKLPILEEQFTNTESQLNDASSRLPDVFVIEKILQNISVIASDLGLLVSQFDPLKAIPSKTAFRYAQLPIQIELSGTYSQIATFFDKVAHLKLLIHIKDFEMAATEGQKLPASLTNKSSNNSNLGNDAVSFEQKWIRRNAKLVAKAKLIIYRSLSEKEQQVIDNVVKNEQKQSKKKKRRRRG